MNLWRAIYKAGWVLLCVLFVVVLICIFRPKYRSLRALQVKKAQIQEENRRIAGAARELRTKQDRFHSDPAFVVHTAREMGMVKPDDTVFKLVTNARRESAEGQQ